MTSINKEFQKKGINKAYLLDKTLRFFRTRRLAKSIDKIEDLLERDKVEEAESLWVASRMIPTSFDLGIMPFDTKTVKEIYKREKTRTSITTGIPSLDRVVGEIKSGWLMLFMGPQKRGKTWMLLHLAVHAALTGSIVVFISLESEYEELAYRIWSNAGSLSTAKESQLSFPYFLKKKNADVDFRDIERPLLTRKTAVQAIKDFNKIASGKLFLKVFPMGSASVEDVRAYLDQIDAYFGFQPTVIVVDYLGIIKSSQRDRKEKYNEVAMGLKELGQEKDAVVVSAHQGRRETLVKVSMAATDTPEDIRILGHIDILCTLNQTEEERKDGVMRIGIPMHRHKKYIGMRQVKILQQLEAGQVALDSRLVSPPPPEELLTGKKKKDKEEFNEEEETGVF